MSGSYHILFAVLISIVILFLVASMVYFLYRRWLAIEDEFGNPTSITFLSANVGNSEISRVMEHFGLMDEDITVLRRNIAAMMPDVVFMQEVITTEHAEGIFDTGDYHIHHEGDVCTALKKNLFTAPEKLSAHPVSDGYSACVSTLIPENRRIVFINVHAVSPLKDSKFMRRAHQIRMIIDKTKEISLSGMDVITAGDFNFDPWRFESMRNRLHLAESESELDRIKKYWFDSLTSGDDGLRLVSGNDKTWFLTYSFTIDHVISNVPSSDFRVLASPDEKLDIDHSMIFDHPHEHFMDHKALFCRFEVMGEGRRRIFQKWRAARLLPAQKPETSN